MGQRPVQKTRVDYTKIYFAFIIFHQLQYFKIIILSKILKIKHSSTGNFDSKLHSCCHCPCFIQEGILFPVVFAGPFSCSWYTHILAALHVWPQQMPRFFFFFKNILSANRVFIKLGKLRQKFNLSGKISSFHGNVSTQDREWEEAGSQSSASYTCFLAAIFAMQKCSNNSNKEKKKLHPKMF